MKAHKIDLTQDQQCATSHFKGPMLVAAGPGSGKTEVLLRRIQNLINKEKVKPESILTCTFTNKATDNIRFRLAGLIHTKAELVQISTIHAFCNQMLREYSEYHDLGENFDVFDSDEQAILVRKLYSGTLKLYHTYLINKRNSISSLVDFFNVLSRNCITTAELQKYYEKNKAWDDFSRRILRAYELYMEYMLIEKKVDFAFLQRYFLELLSSKRDFLKELQNRFHFVLVDEFQDVSPIQFEILLKIFQTKERNNFFAVGDEDQSIYGWRGTDISFFRTFDKYFRDYKKVVLAKNFRSTEDIVKQTARFISGKNKTKKTAEPVRKPGNMVILIKNEDTIDTPNKTVEFIKQLKKKQIINDYKDIVLLFRSVKNHSAEYIEALKDSGIPCIVIGNGAFVERREIQSIIYFMSYLSDASIDEDKFQDWGNWWDVSRFTDDFLALSEKTREALSKTDPDFCIYDLLTENDFKSIGIKNKDDINKLLKLNLSRKDIADKKKKDRKKTGILRIFYEVLEHSGYLKMLLDMKSPDEDTEEKILNIAQLSRLIATFSKTHDMYNMQAFIKYLYFSNRDKLLDEAVDEDKDGIKIMTVHKAKGLEFPVVVMGSLVERRFPGRSRRDKLLIDIPFDFIKRNDPYDDFEEKQRLFYVGLTRAQDMLVLSTYEKMNHRKTKISSFIEELDKAALVDEKTALKKCEKHYEKGNRAAYINFSALYTYLTCAFLYKLNYIYGFQTPASYFQNYGTILHTAVMKINKCIKQAREYDIDDIIRNSWMPLPFAEEKEEKIRANMKDILLAYCDMMKSKCKEIVSVEEPFIKAGDDFVISGKADLIYKDFDGKTNLVDFKARTKKGIEETNVSEQLQMYHYCLKEDRPIDRRYAYTLMDSGEFDVPYDGKIVEEMLEGFQDSRKKGKFPGWKGCTLDCIFKFACGR